MSDTIINDTIVALLYKLVNRQTLLPEEQTMLDQWLANNPKDKEAFITGLMNEDQLFEEIKTRYAFNTNDEWTKMAERLRAEAPQPKIRRLSILRWVAAAVFILAIGSGIYYFNRQSYKSSAIIGGIVGTRVDVAPGMNRAILTIDNNQNIDLETNKTGININSIITYNDGEKIVDAGQFLQLTTPRGGQYQAVLPDGSKVWLNAASSIKFPSKFNDKERQVEVTGEVYFEVAKDASKPFKVSGGGQEIEVLGTSFNINIYDDEPIKKTTLITGSIKITNNSQTAILTPGQQANIPILSILPIRLILVQTEDIIAWKNGIFNFNNADIKSMLRQVARWYDVDVIYEGEIPDRVFEGKMQRNIPLSSALKILELNKINFRVEGRKIVVMP